MKLFRRTLAALAVPLLATLMMPHVAHASPTSTVHSPNVDFRTWEIGFKYGVQDWDDPQQGGQAAKLAVEYGIAPRWKTELELGWSRLPGRAGRVDAVEFENTFQLTERGQHWLDAGLFTEIAHHRDAGETTLEIGPLLQKVTGHQQFNFNVLLERRLDAPDPGTVRHTGVAYQAQWRWRGNPRLQPGVQAFGKLGDLGSLHSRELRAGPVLFGVLRRGDTYKWKYDLGVFAGLTADTPDTTVRLRMQYEFE